jgi:hypothetical protein
MNERNCIAFNEDAREWSNNNRKPYMSTIVGYPFVLIEWALQFPTFIQIDGF